MNAFIEKWANLSQGGPIPQDGTSEITATPAKEVPRSTVLHGASTFPAGGGAQGEPAVTEFSGQAIELWCDHAGGRVFIVADETDAQEAMRRFGARRGEVWTPGEIELVARIEDQAIRDQVATFKRDLDGSLSVGASGKSLSPQQGKAQMLNRLFQQQGVAGEVERITAETVRDGERKAGGNG